MRSASPPAPIGPLLLFTALNSAATGTATLGIFFLTTSAFGFGEGANYGLGLAIGATYVVGALAAGRLSRAVERRGGLEPRGALALGAALFALLCLLPWWSERAWSVFVLAALYSPLSGAFWPIVESYVSGGREAASLRRAVGRFNVVWAGALAVAFWAVAPFVERAPLDVFLGLTLVHAASLVLLLALPSRPGRVPSAGVDAIGAGHERLLRVHRILLAASYLALFALSPYMPAVLAALDVAPDWHTPLASVWMVTRVAGFFVLERWHGWYGRLSTAVIGTLLLVGGFALVMLAPLAAVSFGLALLIVGLATFGVGAAVLYTAALAYALELGAAEVDAGGAHEALIGVGYALGPCAGLLALGAAEHGLFFGATSETSLSILVAAAVLGAAAWAWRSGSERGGAPPPSGG